MPDSGEDLRPRLPGLPRLRLVPRLREMPTICNRAEHPSLRKFMQQLASHWGEERVRRGRSSPSLLERAELPQLHGEHGVIRGEVEVSERSEAAAGSGRDEEEAASERSDGGVHGCS